MGWIFVLLAASAELVGVWGLNLFSQKRNLKNGILYFGGLGLSFALIYLSFKYLPVSIAYAVFTGLGTAGAVLINMFFFWGFKKLVTYWEFNPYHRRSCRLKSIIIRKMAPQYDEVPFLCIELKSRYLG